MTTLEKSNFKIIKIGVLADTHISIKGYKIPNEILQHLKGVELIIHAGDFVDLSVAKTLSRIAPVKAVCGNMDKDNVRKIYPRKQIIKIGKFKIGLIHKLGAPPNRIERLKSEFPESKLDAVVFGHTHLAVNEKKNGILFFNPGSPTDELFSPYKSIGILTISNKIQAKIIKLKDK